ncbi:MAG: DUF58 domain-containing protein [Actinomycetota bacterium]|nr:DUF58 domain-containing protein [Actinomycetota bacterium]
MSPTPRTAWALAACALAALVVPPALALLAALAVVTAAVIDARFAHRPPVVGRQVSTTLSRGVATPLEVDAEAPASSRVLLRQPLTPDVDVHPTEAEGRLEATLVPRRRGRHRLPFPTTRLVGPLGLGRCDHSEGQAADVLVYPDLPAARALALAVRTGRFRDPGRLSRGPLGLGTDFESIREYTPDDDIRQVNWLATARLDRPMSNQYRVEQDREVMCVVDVGRLMAAPLGTTMTRLDAALDAAVAVALVADEVGDRCGALAFDHEVSRHLRPRRSGGPAVVRALFELEPSGTDSDYELAFRTVGGAKRALVLVLTDLLEEAAAGPLVEAVPVLARKHVVVVASTTDPDLQAAVAASPQRALDVYTAAVAVEVLEARARVARLLRRAGAEVVEADPKSLGAACVGAYLKMKVRGRL